MVLKAPIRPRETRVLMADPTFFDVTYVINPFMAQHVGGVDKAVASTQWHAVRDVYIRLGFEVHTLEGVQGLPDMVFMANQSFPVLTEDGETEVILSRMRSTHRKDEVKWVADWYASQGIRTRALASISVFEGMGDCLWVPNEKTILAGYGYRTERGAVDALSKQVMARVIPLRLIHPSFYHLDTCLSPIDSDCAFYVPQAFDSASLQRLQVQFKTLVPVPLDEAVQFLACNGHCPDGQHFIVQKGALQTNALARSLGLTVVEVDTSEFMKSGGSVYCMKLMLP